MLVGAPRWAALMTKVTAILLVAWAVHYRSPLAFAWKEPEQKERAAQAKALADVADAPALELRAGGDAKKRYFLIGTLDRDNPPAAARAGTARTARTST